MGGPNEVVKGAVLKNKSKIVKLLNGGNLKLKKEEISDRGKRGNDFFRKEGGIERGTR